jgi:hypothetical protein
MEELSGNGGWQRRVLEAKIKRRRRRRRRMMMILPWKASEGSDLSI